VSIASSRIARSTAIFGSGKGGAATAPTTMDSTSKDGMTIHCFFMFLLRLWHAGQMSGRHVGNATFINEAAK
jgi:hypothetical protein